MALNRINVSTGDFRYIENLTGENLFVYLDPPYMPEKAESFTSYSQMGFGMREQERLRNICDTLTKRGVKIMQSNSLTPEIKDLYREYNIKEVSAPRSISAKGDGRGSVTEVIITNY